MPPKKKADPGLSIRAYAKGRGRSDRAVRNAIKAGRLRKSIRKQAGQPRIIDPDLADREWAENTQHDRVPMHVLRKREELAKEDSAPDHVRDAAIVVFPALRSACAAGAFAYITSNKWYRAKYGERLRSWINRQARLQRIIDFGCDSACNFDPL